MKKENLNEINYNLITTRENTNNNNNNNELNNSFNNKNNNYDNYSKTLINNNI